MTRKNGLSPEQKSRFETDGAIAPVPVMSPDEAATLRARIERIEEARGGRLSAFANAKPHLLLPWLWDLVHDPRIVDPVADLLGPDLLCWGTSLINKPAASAAHIAWHQDATYWGLSEPRAVTAWIAITPSTPQSGCVRILPGTHQDQLPHMDSGDPNNLLGAKEKLRDDIDPDQARDLILAPGEMSIHDVLVVHGSAPNTSPDRRVGFAVRFIPGDVHQQDGSATLVRGKDAGRMPLEIAPKSEFDPEAMARHTDIVRRSANLIRTRKQAHAEALRAKTEGQTP